MTPIGSYRFIRPILFLPPPEFSHRLSIHALMAFGWWAKRRDAMLEALEGRLARLREERAKASGADGEPSP